MMNTEDHSEPTGAIKNIVESLQNELQELGYTLNPTPRGGVIIKSYHRPDGSKVSQAIVSLTCKDDCIWVQPSEFQVDYAEPGGLESLFEVLKTLNNAVRVTETEKPTPLQHNLPFTIEYYSAPRVQIRHCVTIDGKRYDFEDLLETLQNVRDGQVILKRYTKHLKELGVIERAGSQRHLSCASFGPHGELLVDELERHELLLLNEGNL